MRAQLLVVAALVMSTSPAFSGEEKLLLYKPTRPVVPTGGTGIIVPATHAGGVQTGHAGLVSPGPVRGDFTRIPLYAKRHYNVRTDEHLTATGWQPAHTPGFRPGGQHVATGGLILPDHSLVIAGPNAGEPSRIKVVKKVSPQLERYLRERAKGGRGFTAAERQAGIDFLKRLGLH